MLVMRKDTIVTIGIVVFLGIGFALAVTARLSDSERGSEYAARERGAMYLGTNGVIMQDKTNTCGPAALKMVLDVYNREIALRDLEKGDGNPRAGWSMQALKEGAEQYGLTATGWRFDLEALSKSRFPMILFIEKKHFAVVDSMDTNGFFFLRDPAIGRMKIGGSALRKIWNGETLVFRESGSPKE